MAKAGSADLPFKPPGRFLVVVFNPPLKPRRPRFDLRQVLLQLLVVAGQDIPEPPDPRTPIGPRIVADPRQRALLGRPRLLFLALLAALGQFVLPFLPELLPESLLALALFPGPAAFPAFLRPRQPLGREPFPLLAPLRQPGLSYRRLILRPGGIDAQLLGRPLPPRRIHPPGPADRRHVTGLHRLRPGPHMDLRRPVQHIGGLAVTAGLGLRALLGQGPVIDPVPLAGLLERAVCMLLPGLAPGFERVAAVPLARFHLVQPSLGRLAQGQHDVGVEVARIVAALGHRLV